KRDACPTSGPTACDYATTLLPQVPVCNEISQPRWCHPTEPRRIRLPAGHRDVPAWRGGKIDGAGRSEGLSVRAGMQSVKFWTSGKCPEFLRPPHGVHVWRPEAV